MDIYSELKELRNDAWAGRLDTSDIGDRLHKLMLAMKLDHLETIRNMGE